MRIMFRPSLSILRGAALSLGLALVAGCAALGTKNDLLTSTLDSYAATIRWGNFEDAASFVDPEMLKAQPLGAVDLARFAQVRVTGYNAQPLRPNGDNEVRQTVEIELVNNNTQSLRAIVDRQVWRYDEKAKRWWLVSGLPDITQH
jgi:hypothetical protein